MLSKHNINETLAWLDNNDQKIDFLENIQEDLFNLFEADKITEEDHDDMMDFTTNKAKQVLKSNK